MLFTVFFYVFMIVSIINLVHLGAYLVGANMYDVYGFKRATAKKKRLRRNALATILIAAHNEEQTIERCLDSVRRSTMRNLEIIVIDDASTDRTREVMVRIFARILISTGRSKCFVASKMLARQMP